MAKYSSTGTDVKGGNLFAGCTINNPVFGEDPRVAELEQRNAKIIDSSHDMQKKFIARNNELAQEVADVRQMNGNFAKENAELGRQLRKATRELKKWGKK